MCYRPFVKNMIKCSFGMPEMFDSFTDITSANEKPLQLAAIRIIVEFSATFSERTFLF